MEWTPDHEAVTIQEEELPGCCSVNVLHEADFQDAKDLPHAITAILDGEGDLGQKGLLLYCLTDDQKAEAAAVIGAGFKPLVKFGSTSSERNLTLYGLVQKEPKATATRRRR